MSSEFYSTTVGEQITLQRGFDITKKEQEEGDIPVVSSGGISSYHNVAKVSGPGVVLGRKGTLGTVFFIEEDYWPHDTTLWVKDFKGNNPSFVYYFFKNMSKQLKDMDVGAANPALNRNHVHPLEIKWPRSDVQKKISKILSSLDNKIKNNDSINQTLEQMAQALFKSWFVDFEPVKAKITALEAGGSQEDATLAAMTAISGKDADALTVFEREHPEQYAELQATAELFPSAMQDSELGNIPVTWEMGKLQDLLVLQRGFDLPSSARKDGEFPLIAASGPNGTHNVAMAKAPGVVTGRSGVLGKVYLTLEDYWPLNTTLWVKEFKRATPCYAYELLRLLDMKAFNAGSAVPSLNRNHIHSLSYPLPPMELVNLFESSALLLHHRAHVNLKHSQSLALLRDTLLPKLLSGEITLPEAERAVSEAENV
jgi:type I restriction enzyme S subunit